MFLTYPHDPYGNGGWGGGGGVETPNCVKKTNMSQSAFDKLIIISLVSLKLWWFKGVGDSAMGHPVYDVKLLFHLFIQ